MKRGRVLRGSTGLLFMFLALFLNGTLAFGERAFGRYRGRALAFGIPLYQGTPPSNCPYRSLGSVAGEATGGRVTVSQRASNALEALATQAKATGANAVIKVEGHKVGWAGLRYEGEAVVFETLPSDKAEPSGTTP